MSFFKKLIGGEKAPPPDQKETIRRWSRELNRKIREVERDSNNIKREEKKILMEMKRDSAKLSPAALRTLASSVVKARKTVANLHTNCTQIKSVVYELEYMSSQIRVAKILGSSANLMKAMQSMTSVDNVHDICRQMGQEMFNAGLINEMIDDTFEVMQDEDEDVLVDEEVDKVMGEVIDGYLSKEEMKDRSQKEEKKAVESVNEEDEMLAKLGMI